MYTYYDLLDDVQTFRELGIEVGSIGESVEGREIPYVFMGEKTGTQIIITGGIHAREHISSALVALQMFQGAGQIQGGGVYFVPMLNPDGNLIATIGLKELDRSRREFVEGLCGNKSALYKANASGVDLNTNFDARWGTGKSNAFMPSSENFVGFKPFSEPETRAIRDFTLKIKPACTVSYHAAGREIYWDFYQEGALRERSQALAEYINSSLDYALLSNDFSSAGGYKDWCIEHLKIPSLTIELAPPTASHPINDYGCAAHDFSVNAGLPIKILEFLKG